MARILNHTKPRKAHYRTVQIRSAALGNTSHKGKGETMASKTQFALIHIIKNTDNGTEQTDVVAVSDTLIGAETYGQKMIKHVYGLDMFFRPVGWGVSTTDSWPAERFHNLTHRFGVRPVAKVNTRTAI